MSSVSSGGPRKRDRRILSRARKTVRGNRGGTTGAPALTLPSKLPGAGEYEPRPPLFLARFSPFFRRGSNGNDKRAARRPTYPPDWTQAPRCRRRAVTRERRVASTAKTSTDASGWREGGGHKRACDFDVARSADKTRSTGTY